MASFISYILIRAGKIIFAAVPFRLVYIVSDGVAWLLRYLVRYRFQTSAANLRKAFPDASPGEIKKYLHKSYRNFSDIMLETIKGFTLSVPQLERRFVFTNPELLKQYFEKGQSVVLTLGHTGNWEWAGLALGNLAPQQILCVYHRLKNTYIDKLILEERSRTGLVLYPKGDTVKLLKHLSGICGAMMLAADQSPANAAAAKWVRFFGVETGFAPGPELVSKRFNYPLVHMSMKRIRRGYYEATFHTLSGNPELESANVLSQLYANAVENEIRKAPPDWLWSHKRWKKKKPATLKNR